MFKREDMPLLPEILYYVHLRSVHINMLNPNGIECEVKILPIPTKFGFILNEPHAEGPFWNLEHLYYSSIGYNLVKVGDAHKASELLFNKIRRTDNKFLNTYFKPDFIDVLPIILKHTFVGNVRRNELTGVHFYHTDLKLIGIEKKIGEKGVFQNDVSVYHSQKKIWLSKYKPSTFWPYNWNIEKIGKECAFAWHNRTKMPDSGKEIGLTSNGIQVVFYFREGILKTVYPIS